jgi:flagellar biosynthesis protein FlhF
VLTKLDEATSLGGAISALIRSRLPVAYVSDGQRVPEDLSPARAHQLIARAVELPRKAGASPDEDLLRRRFGPVAHALA